MVYNESLHMWEIMLILHRRTSIMHGRPASIARSEVSADLPTNSPTFDSPSFGNMMAFIDLVSLTGDVAEILSAIVDFWVGI